MGFVSKELEQTQYNGVKVVKSGATRDIWGLEMYEEQEITVDIQREQGEL